MSADPAAGPAAGEGVAIDWENLTLADLDRIFDVPFVFWMCPKGCRGMVDWQDDGAAMTATCKVCGETSKPYQKPEVPHVRVEWPA